MTKYGEYCLFLHELFAFACKAKRFVIAFLFFLFLHPVVVLGRTYKRFFAHISSFAMQDGVTRIRPLSLDTQANIFVKATLIVKFRMCEYDIPCALEKISMADLSALIAWFCKITWQAKTIIFPLPQCLKPQNLVG